MTAETLTGASASASGLRPIDPRRDMGQVADLIEIAFRGDLDPTGRRMVREMRALGRMGWIGWALSQVLLPPAARPMGFVWEESGQVVGNASLLPVAGHKKRWVMANVAVHPEYRRRGIGRQMVEAAGEFAHREGARSIYLQVESDNPAALTLYDSLGYEAFTTRTTWKRRRGVSWRPELPARGVRLRKSGEWPLQWALAERVSPEGLVWPHPLEPDYFRHSGFERFLGRGGKWHLVQWEQGRLAGSLTVQGSATVRFVLIADPTAQGHAEKGLVGEALNRIRPERRSVVMDYTADVAAQDLKRMGFQEERTLTWMKIRLRAR